MISAVLVTFNEEIHLGECLESIRDKVDEIVVVDLGSSDNTLKIARQYQAKIYPHKKVDYVEQVREFASLKANGDWILVLDPDERMTIPLWNELLRVSSEDKYAAVNIPRKNIFFGKWIAHTNWWPDRQIRFFKKTHVKWSQEIHSYPAVVGKILYLAAKEDLAIIHYGYASVSQFIKRHNRYSTIEAQNRFRKGERFSFWQMVWRPQREFLVRFIKHQGYLDVFWGLALTILMMIYQLMISVKIWELERTKQ